MRPMWLFPDVHEPIAPTIQIILWADYGLYSAHGLVREWLDTMLSNLLHNRKLTICRCSVKVSQRHRGIMPITSAVLAVACRVNTLMLSTLPEKQSDKREIIWPKKQKPVYTGLKFMSCTFSATYFGSSITPTLLSISHFCLLFSTAYYTDNR